ncbi:MAG TPA: efflux RND transporter periplasmic adaptor subunit [Thermoanaerobaculia bacterium]|nr:efflux RND transporter periplasmic adaptor subunit [Thermoanaerobaculia bacterium]
MKKAVIGTLAVLALGAIVFASLRGTRREHGDRVYAEAAARRDVTQVVKASGGIRARVSVDISAHVVAKIERLYVKEGDTVRAGQPFLELERQAFTAAADSWQAQLRQARTGVRQAEVDLADAEVKLRRGRRLTAEGIVAGEELEAAELERTSAELRLEQAREAVEQAQANLAKALDDLSKTTIAAPVSGRVVELNAEEGEVVVSGMMNNPATRIATIADLSELLAELDVDENEVVRVAVGQPVTVTVDAVPDRSYRGRVVEVGSSGSTRAGQGDVTFFEVDVLLDDADERLRPGMSVRAEIEVAAREDALVVPIQAVVEREPEAPDEPAEGGGEAPVAVRGGGERTVEEVVFVVADGKAQRRRVATGLSTVTDVEITAGLEAGEQVVTGPFRTLRDLDDGDAVRIVEEDEGEEEDEEEDED